ncbi:putative F-box/LRR-repeat protein 23 [Impatiens glandulifera]|uniref:putative F-box/LRR-repeat protein 23 n=1 Tax=Impatiens glandulifera TaxID=253017 RepID=UPI001FB0ABF1|nr:putative F-box/LRR-repeat protein 23 [Impatiens glandulifera]
MLSISHSLRSAAESSSLTLRPSKEVMKVGNWVDFLPRDISLEILQKVGTIDKLMNIQKVSISWYRICQDPKLWRSIDIQNIKDLPYTSNNIVKMAMNAIDRSRGQLIDLKIEDFGSEYLLMHLINRGNQLRSLRLVKCLNLFNEGLIEAVKKLPYLEELHIYYGKITYVGLELIGRNCPGLKSLTYNKQGMFPPVYFDYDEDDGHNFSNEAFAIARSMPELRHLSLFGNQMYNDGLEAILDSCPHLESLDIRQCFRVELEECYELSEKCFSIKGFRPPNDCTDDYEFDSSTLDGQIIHIGNEGYFYIGGEDDYHTENYGEYRINDFLGENVSRGRGGSGGGD